MACLTLDDHKVGKLGPVQPLLGPDNDPDDHDDCDEVDVEIVSDFSDSVVNPEANYEQKKTCPSYPSHLRPLHGRDDSQVYYQD